MKTWTLCLLGFLSLAIVAWSQAQPATSAGAENAILTLENEWLQAAKTQNLDPIASNYDDRLVNTDSDGKVLTKAQGMAELKATKFTSAEYEDVKVVVFGDTAIAVGGFKAKGIDHKGKPFAVHERWTDTWIKKPGGGWVCVASHSSSVS
jgi:ketosteroid isomerase-like protein